MSNLIYLDDYLCMNATEEWLRYIENRVIKQEYGITKYSDGEEIIKEDPGEEENKKEEK